MAAADSKKVVLAALTANLCIAVTKGVAAVITHSGAMLAETIHSVADSGNQALLLFGMSRAKRPPDKTHPFGYGSERYFWAFVVALVLFTLGSLFSLYGGVSKLLNPTPIRSVGWAYGVLLASMVFEAYAMYAATKAVNKERRGRSLWRFFVESKDPNLSVVFLEDAGALLGLVFALAGVSAAHILGWTWADGAATVAVGILLGAIAIALLIRCYRFLIGESASPEDQVHIQDAIDVVDGVKEVVSLKTIHLGPETLLISMEAKLTGGVETVRELEREIRSRIPHAVHVAIEPA